MLPFLTLTPISGTPTSKDEKLKILICNLILLFAKLVPIHAIWCGAKPVRPLPLSHQYQSQVFSTWQSKCFNPAICISLVASKFYNFPKFVYLFVQFYGDIIDISYCLSLRCTT